MTAPRITLNRAATALNRVGRVRARLQEIVAYPASTWPANEFLRFPVDDELQLLESMLADEVAAVTPDPDEPGWMLDVAEDVMADALERVTQAMRANGEDILNDTLHATRVRQMRALLESGRVIPVRRA